MRVMIYIAEDNGEDHKIVIDPCSLITGIGGRVFALTGVPAEDDGKLTTITVTGTFRKQPGAHW